MNKTANEINLHSDRLKAILEKLSDWEVNSILVESASNRFWLSGFSGSAGWLLVSEEKAILGTDSRYWVQASSQSPEFELMKFEGDPEIYMAELVSQAADGPIGVESQHLSMKQFKQLTGYVEAEWVQLDGALESLRKIKSNEEIQTIKKAAALTDHAMAKVNELAKPGISERELAWQLEKTMREAGASGLSFPVIVASGPNAARPHHEPADRRLAAGDSIVVDMGAKFGSYCSDLTRSFFLGDQLSSQFSEIYGTVLTAQENALNNMKSGMSGAEIDSLSRTIIDNAGYGGEFGHGLGHGVGIDIHESPNLSPRAPNVGLPACSVVTVEPGIYVDNWGGVRIEDLVMLTDEGAEILSQCQKIPHIPA